MVRSTLGSKPAPPCGKPSRAVPPHSPWQLLITSRMMEKEMSIRALAKAASTASAPLGHTRLFNWLRTPEGCPERSSYTSEINQRIARALGINPASLAAAYDESRKAFNATESAATAAKESLRASIAEFEAISGSTIPKKAAIAALLQALAKLA